MSDELSPEAKELLDATRGGDLPSDADRERLRGKVAAAIGGAGAASTLGAAGKASASVAPGGSAAAGTSAAGAAGAAGAGALTGGKLVLALAGAVAVAGGVAVVATPAPAPAPERAPAAAPAEAPAPTPAPAPDIAPGDAPAPQDVGEAKLGHESAGRSARQAETGKRGSQIRAGGGEPPGVAHRPSSGDEAAPRTRPTGAKRPASPPADGPATPAPSASTATAEAAAPTALHVDNPHASSIQAELTLLGAAQYHLREGDAQEALKLLDRHRGRFPSGALVQERVAARAMALCALGRQSEARDELRALETNAAGTPLLARVKAACSSGSAP